MFPGPEKTYPLGIEFQLLTRYPQQITRHVGRLHKPIEERCAKEAVANVFCFQPVIGMLVRRRDGLNLENDDPLM
jgi:hypothetical protein